MLYHNRRPKYAKEEYEIAIKDTLDTCLISWST